MAENGCESECECDRVSVRVRVSATESECESECECHSGVNTFEVVCLHMRRVSKEHLTRRMVESYVRSKTVKSSSLV